MNTTRYAFGLEGNGYFLRNAADAQQASIEPFFDGPEWEYAPEYFESIPALKQQHRPTALGGLDSSRPAFAKKVFDEVYERTLKRPVGALLDSFFAKATVPDGKQIECRDVIYLEDIDLVVVIRVVVNREVTASVHDWLLQAHRAAHEYIEQNGRKAPIHCHRIEGGRVDLEPKLFDSLEQIKQHDKAQLKALRRYEN